jgi:LmbE family N-acetylglucosaminyl deacetylase
MCKSILVLGPHTDDGEWGCGASIHKWISAGHEVNYVAFSAAEESVPDNLSPDILRSEILVSASLIGINQSNLRVLSYRVRYFPRDRQEILEDMIKLRNEINPSLVVVPSSNDTHQDHEVINREAFRAFKRSSILGYEIPWNCPKNNLSFYNKVSNESLDAKILSISAYKSQIFRAPNYKEMITSLALQRGSVVGASFAEAFEVIRWVEN